MLLSISSKFKVNRFMKIFTAVLLMAAVSNYLYHLLVYYTEKSTFIKYLSDERNLPDDVFDIYITGDSQVMSGINPHFLKNKLTGSNTTGHIYYSPEPSGQPEGILANVLELKRKKIKYNKLIVNISPLHITKNPFTDSHRSLGVNSSKFRIEYFTSSLLANFYLKNAPEGIYYLLMQGFPLLKLNGNFSRELRIIPSSEGLEKTDRIDKYIERDFRGNLLYNREINRFLETELFANNYYYEWGKKETYEGNCLRSPAGSRPPEDIYLAFSHQRKSSLDALSEIYKITRDDSIELYILEIPFSPSSEKILENRLNAYESGLNELKQKAAEAVFIKIEWNLFDDSDYADYIHPNRCGMKVITSVLAEHITKRAGLHK